MIRSRLALFLLGVGAFLGYPAEARPPNIIFFVADDMRPYHFNCLPEGRGKNLTPHLDRLAGEGTVLAGMHVTSPICTPSRYGFLAGRYPSRARNGWFQERTRKEGQSVVEFNTYIVEGEDTLPRRLRRAGYTTGMFGKNHVVEARDLERFPDFDAPARDPENQARLKRNHERVCAAMRAAGFDEADRVYHNNPDFLGLREVAVQNMDWITEGAVGFIERHHGEPFFLYVASTIPHAPTEAARSWEADPRVTAEGYLERAPAVQPPRATLAKRLREAGLPVDEDTANVLWLDDALGALLAALEEKGELDNTVVFFLSDHGQNAKGTLYQGGVHNPAIVWRKGGFAAGPELDALLSNVDVAPTMLDLAGAATAEEVHDGRSFWPLLTGEEVPSERALYFELGYTRAIRKGDWKYLAVRYPEQVEGMAPGERAEALAAWNRERRRKHLTVVNEDPTRPFSHLTPIPGGGHAEHESTGTFPGYFDRDQLYHLREDPAEQVNLAGRPEHEEVLHALQAELRKRLNDLPGDFPL